MERRPGLHRTRDAAGRAGQAAEGGGVKGYRYIPLEGHLQAGVVVPPEGRAFIAKHFTPAQAKADAQRLLDERQ